MPFYLLFLWIEYQETSFRTRLLLIPRCVVDFDGFVIFSSFLLTFREVNFTVSHRNVFNMSELIFHLSLKEKLLISKVNQKYSESQIKENHKFMVKLLKHEIRLKQKTTKNALRTKLNEFFMCFVNLHSQSFFWNYSMERKLVSQYLPFSFPFGNELYFN